MLDEEEVLKEFNTLLEEKIAEYTAKYGKPPINDRPIDIFIGDKVWDSEIKYHRMMMITKQKFFEYLYEGKSIEAYEKAIRELWGSIDHEYMTKAIEELRLMVMSEDFKNAKITQRSIKLQNFWEEYEQGEKEIYTLNPERDFRTIENRYVNRHIKLYKNMKKRYEGKENIEDSLARLVESYDKLDKTIPYYSHTTGKIKCYNTISTYNSMLYNINLLRASWNRTAYDSRLLGNNLYYLPAHTFTCPMCMEFQGYVYAEGTPSLEDSLILASKGKPGYPYVNDAIENGVGHPNCKHNWTLYWSEEQIQQDKYDSAEWEEKYKNRQKIQSLDLEKSRLLANRRIYQNLGQQDLVDKTTAKIKALREKKKDLENLSKGVYTNKYEQYKNNVAKAKEKTKQKEIQKILKEKELKKSLQKQSYATHKEMQELFKIRENRPKYIEQLERKQQELKEARKIINQNNKDMKYWEAKQQELSLKVDIKNLKELINK